MAMTEHEAVSMMERHGIKPTANRITIVRTLAGAAGPMSLTELEYKILTIDKSSISRALSIFRDKHLVHVIESGESSRYELCMAHDVEKDDDMHVHFYCERCHRTTCLEGIPVPSVELPEGFSMTTTDYMVKGLCPDCNHKR